MAAEGLDEQLGRWRRRQRRYLLQVALSGLTFGAMLWFFSGYQEVLKYSFSGEAPLVAMGEAPDSQPSDFVHNSYVSLKGITEHRGLTQKMVRGLAVSRQEYWYFRLLGSSGVFIEVAPDKEKYDMATAVEVQGRVVDPTQDPNYTRLMELYNELFFPRPGAEIRIIQVGVVPGQGQGPFVAVLVFLLALGIANILSLIRLIRLRLMRPG